MNKQKNRTEQNREEKKRRYVLSCVATDCLSSCMEGKSIMSLPESHTSSCRAVTLLGVTKALFFSSNGWRHRMRLFVCAQHIATTTATKRKH